MNAAARRVLSLLLVAAVVGSGVAATAHLASAQSNFVLVHTDVTPTQPTTDENFTVSTVVSNDDESDSRYAVKRVRVYEKTGDGDRTKLNQTEPRNWVHAGQTKTTDLSVGIDEVGTHELLVRVRLTSPSDGTRVVRRTITVDVRQPHPVLDIEFEPTVAGAATNGTVRVANGLDRPIRNVELRLEPSEATFRTRTHTLALVEAGTERSVGVDVSGQTNGTETVRAKLAYDYNGTRYATTQTLESEFVRPTNPGHVALTNLRVEPNGDALRIRGTASNPGASNVTGVTVSVLDGENVGPAANNSDFFVGRIEPSDFGTFETRAAPETNGTVTVPVRVSYYVDGVPHEAVRNVTYAPPADTVTEESSGGLPVELLGGAAAVLVGGGVVVWRVRRGS